MGVGVRGIRGGIAIESPVGRSETWNLHEKGGDENSNKRGAEGIRRHAMTGATSSSKSQWLPKARPERRNIRYLRCERIWLPTLGTYLGNDHGGNDGPICI